jgi:hypothetical protein
MDSKICKKKPDELHSEEKIMLVGLGCLAGSKTTFNYSERGDRKSSKIERNMDAVYTQFFGLSFSFKTIST